MFMELIKVHVVRRPGKGYFLRYTDPITGTRHERKADATTKKRALVCAGEFEAELKAGGINRTGTMPWGEFEDDFLMNHIGHLSEGYITNVTATFNAIGQHMRPDTLQRVTAAWLKQFKTKMLKVKSKATVHKYLQHLKTALVFAQEQGYIQTVPNFPRDKRKKKTASRSKHMKGRPITLEEFERMLAATDRTSMRHLLTGLWLSGLRLSEALSLTWDQWGEGIRVKVDGEDVMLLIDGDDQKSGEMNEYPTTADFAAFLLETPPEHRQGFVFNPTGARGNVSRRLDTVSPWIRKIGKTANVKTDERNGKTVFASAHDLRRSFGSRWAQVIPSPIILRDLMRHADVSTTEKYYVGINAKRTAAHLRSLKPVEKVNWKVNQPNEATQEFAENPKKQEAADRT